MPVLKMADLSIGGNITYTGDVQKISSKIAKTINTTGTASRNITNTIAIINMVTTKESKDYIEVYTALRERSIQTVNLIDILGVKKVSTDKFTISPIFTYNPKMLDKYSGQYTIIFECDIDEAGEIIDRVMRDENGFIINDISYTATESIIKSTETEILAEATINAIERIDTALKKTDYKRTDIYDISIQQKTGFSNVETYRTMAIDSGAPPILSFDTTVKSTVYVKSLFE